jgi:hypothetical protein
MLLGDAGEGGASSVSSRASSSYHVQMADPQTKRQRKIGSYASEEDAARAYDFAAVQAHGPGVKRNFSGEAISEPPVALGEERKQQKSSRYVGVCWSKGNSSWVVRLYDPQSQRTLHVGCFASEEDAARAYDFAAVARGPDAKRNFLLRPPWQTPLRLNKAPAVKQKKTTIDLLMASCGRHNLCRDSIDVEGWRSTLRWLMEDGEAQVWLRRRPRAYCNVFVGGEEEEIFQV